MNVVPYLPRPVASRDSPPPNRAQPDRGAADDHPWEGKRARKEEQEMASLVGAAPQRDHPRPRAPSSRASSGKASPASRPHQLPPELNATNSKLRTTSGRPVRSVGLGGNRHVKQSADLVSTAHDLHGVNYFFAYSLNDDEYGGFLDGLQLLCADPVVRADLFIAVRA